MSIVYFVPSEEYVEQYRLAGFRRTNIGGIVLCDVCYSLVSYEHTIYHLYWHEDMEKEDNK